MKITARHRSGVTILEVHGKITIGVGDIAFGVDSRFEKFHASSQRRFLIVVQPLGGIAKRVEDQSGYGSAGSQ